MGGRPLFHPAWNFYSLVALLLVLQMLCSRQKSLTENSSLALAEEQYTDLTLISFVVLGLTHQAGTPPPSYAAGTPPPSYAPAHSVNFYKYFSEGLILLPWNIQHVTQRLQYQPRNPSSGSQKPVWNPFLLSPYCSSSWTPCLSEPFRLEHKNSLLKIDCAAPIKN